MAEEDEWEDVGSDDEQSGVDYMVLSKDFRGG